MLRRSRGGEVSWAEAVRCPPLEVEGCQRCEGAALRRPPRLPSRNSGPGGTGHSPSPFTRAARRHRWRRTIQRRRLRRLFANSPPQNRSTTPSRTWRGYYSPIEMPSPLGVAAILPSSPSSLDPFGPPLVLDVLPSCSTPAPPTALCALSWWTCSVCLQALPRGPAWSAWLPLTSLGHWHSRSAFPSPWARPPPSAKSSTCLHWIWARAGRHSRLGLDL